MIKNTKKMKLQLDIITLFKVIKNAKTSSEIINEIVKLATECTEICATLNSILEDDEHENENNTSP